MRAEAARASAASAAARASAAAAAARASAASTALAMSARDETSGRGDAGWRPTAGGGDTDSGRETRGSNAGCCVAGSLVAGLLLPLSATGVRGRLILSPSPLSSAGTSTGGGVAGGDQGRLKRSLGGLFSGAQLLSPALSFSSDASSSLPPARRRRAGDGASRGVVERRGEAGREGAAAGARRKMPRRRSLRLAAGGEGAASAAASAAALPAQPKQPPKMRAIRPGFLPCLFQVDWRRRGCGVGGRRRSDTVARKTAIERPAVPRGPARSSANGTRSPPSFPRQM